MDDRTETLIRSLKRSGATIRRCSSRGRRPRRSDGLLDDYSATPSSSPQTFAAIAEIARGHQLADAIERIATADTSSTKGFETHALHLVTLLFDRTMRPKINSPIPAGADLALAHRRWRYITVLRGLFLGSSHLMALGLPLLFFLRHRGGNPDAFFANLGDRSFLAADFTRRHIRRSVQVRFDRSRHARRGVPRFIRDLDPRTREKSCEEHSGNIRSAGGWHRSMSPQLWWASA